MVGSHRAEAAAGSAPVGRLLPERRREGRARARGASALRHRKTVASNKAGPAPVACASTPRTTAWGEAGLGGVERPKIRATSALHVRLRWARAGNAVARFSAAVAVLVLRRRP